MIFLAFLVISVISAIAAIALKNKLAILASLICAVISLVIPAGIYTSNIGKIADLEAFYIASATNFEISRDDTASYLSENKIQSNVTLIPITGSIERMGVGQSIANRVLEYRNSVNAYNSAFAKYRAYKKNVLYGIAYPSIPEEMRLIIINPVQNESPSNTTKINQPEMTPVPDTKSPSVSIPEINNTENNKEIQETLNKILETLGK